MSFDKLVAAVVIVVTAAAVSGKLPVLQRWIWKSQAQAVYEGRTSTWGSPHFFPDRKF